MQNCYEINMKLIIGIGNPGEKYKNNRHNVGHMVIDAIEKLPKDLPAGRQGVVAKKTNIFMNDSGREVKKLTTNYKLQTKDLYIVHDDLDIPLGKYKIQFGRGPKVHNGVNDVERELGTSEFWRIRVGVENRPSRVSKESNVPRVSRVGEISGEKYMLQDFTEEERKVLTEVFRQIVEEVSSLLK